MNRPYGLLLPLLAFSCVGKYRSDAPKVSVNPIIEQRVVLEADTLRINMAKSKIDWAATEMRGTKRRTGILSFKEGYFLIKNSEMVGGTFMVDMGTMDVTDVPIHERIARKNLIDHLKSDDFFDVTHYPTAAIELTKTQKTNNDSLKISGNLTIRDVTKNIEFLAHQKDHIFRTNFTFNRFDWNIAYEGSWADKTLVDKDVELTIKIVTQ